jgi:hypothetical protein
MTHINHSTNLTKKKKNTIQTKKKINEIVSTSKSRYNLLLLHDNQATVWRGSRTSKLNAGRLVVTYWN